LGRPRATREGSPGRFPCLRPGAGNVCRYTCLPAFRFLVGKWKGTASDRSGTLRAASPYYRIGGKRMGPIPIAGRPRAMPETDGWETGFRSSRLFRNCVISVSLGIGTNFFSRAGFGGPRRKPPLGRTPRRRHVHLGALHVPGSSLVIATVEMPGIRGTGARGDNKSSPGFVLAASAGGKLPFTGSLPRGCRSGGRAQKTFGPGGVLEGQRPSFVGRAGVDGRWSAVDVPGKNLFCFEQRWRIARRKKGRRPGRNRTGVGQLRRSGSCPVCEKGNGWRSTRLS